MGKRASLVPFVVDRTEQLATARGPIGKRLQYTELIA